MNRKQEVAIAVGAAVIIGLALFPTRTLRIEEPDGEGWNCIDKPPTVLVRWVGWRSPSPPQHVIYEGKVRMDPRAGDYYYLLDDKGKEEYLKAHAEGRLPEWYEPVYTERPVHHRVSLLTLALSIAAALALTLAAVLVLRDRKRAP